MAGTTDTTICRCKKQSPHITVLIPTALWNLLGTSMANHLAMASIIEPGDEVLIEHPAYGPIFDVAQYLYADVKRFRRIDENGWAIDPKEVRDCITPKTRLIVITNLTQSNKRAYARFGSARNWRHRAQHRRVSCWWMKFIWMRSTNDTPRTSFHLGPELRCDKQPNEGLRRQRTTMWLDPGAARISRGRCAG